MAPAGRTGYRRRGMRVVSLTVSVDTEEDQWGPGQGEPTVENVRALGAAHRQLISRGLRSTWFCTQPVVETPFSLDVLRELRATGHAELGAHLHPWTTRPFHPGCSSMLHALPAALQHAKLASLTESLEVALGVTAPPFRAGRWALGPETAQALLALGYRIDSSVMPGMAWASDDGRVDYLRAARAPHRFEPSGIGTPNARGTLVEIPVSVGCTRPGHALWDTIAPTVRSLAPLRRLSTAIHHTGLLRKVQLTPEIGEPRDLAAATRALIEDGATHLHVFWHSQSHSPPAHFVRTAADVTTFWRRLDAILDAAHAHATIRPATVSEVAAAYLPRAP